LQKEKKPFSAIGFPTGLPLNLYFNIRTFTVPGAGPQRPGCGLLVAISF